MLARLALALGALTLLACDVAPTPITLVPADDELHALLVRADEAWEAQGVPADRIHVAEPGRSGGYPVEWADTAIIRERCGGEWPGACTGAERMLVNNDLGLLPSLQRTASHELGHLIRGAHDGADHLGEHEGCTVTPVQGQAVSAPHLMCAWNAPGASEAPTAADAAFVCSSPYAGC